MPISFGGSNIGAIYVGDTPIKEVYSGSQLVWSSSPSWQPLPELINFEDAYSSPFRVVYAGSSTTQGYNQPQYETYAQLLTARIARQSPGANASKMIKRTSGSQTLPTANGFHFLNVGLGGTTSANYLDTTKRNLANNFQPKFVVHMIGSNDYSQQMPVSTYKSNIETVLNNMQSTFHVLVHTYRREDRSDTGITWAQYGQALKDIADARPNVMFVDASQDWQDRRDGASDWLQGDNIHTSWKGAQGLSEAVADGMGLEVHAGQTVWGFSQDELIAASPGTGEVDSLGPTQLSLAQVNATQGTSADRPRSVSSGLFRALNFNYSGVRNLDTPGFGAFSFPITFYAVCSVRNTNTSNGTVVQPFFSRSVSDDDGWWWVWQDRGVPEVRAALNSAFSGTFNYGFDNFPILYAVHMTANNRASVYVNSLTPRTVLAPDQVAEDSGPWMKSIRIGANAGRTSYTASSFREMSWELSDYEQSDVQDRLTALASQYGITLDP